MAGQSKSVPPKPKARPLWPDCRPQLPTQREKATRSMLPRRTKPDASPSPVWRINQDFRIRSGPIIPPSGVPFSPFILDNEERFSLGGAAHKSLREDSYARIRAGERKTCWTKPRSGWEGLWALNAPRCFAGCAAALPRASIGCLPHSNRAAERSALPTSGRWAAVLAPSTPSRRERRRRDEEAGVSALLVWTGGAGS
jgi:hypothetical protein